MAYDGIVINCIQSDIKKRSMGARVLKVQQPSDGVITLTLKALGGGQTKLYISANASLPIVYIADTLPQAPMQAPAFCMLLRKHIGNGKLKDIRQPGFDRIYDFVFEHMDEMGDINDRHLIVEIMGRQSNIILTDESMRIIDAIKRVPMDESERFVLPGQDYEWPDSQGKISPLEISDSENLRELLTGKHMPAAKAIYTSITGFSKGIAEEIVYRSGVDARKSSDYMDEDELASLVDVTDSIINRIKAAQYSPCMATVDGVPKDYHAIPLTMYGCKAARYDDASQSNESEISGADGDIDKNRYDDFIAGNSPNKIQSNQNSDMSEILVTYYREQQRAVLVKSKGQDMSRLIDNLLARAVKKYDARLMEQSKTEDMDKYRIYGELINTYGYGLRGGEKSLTCQNYYDENHDITIPLDETLTAQENAQKYFARYNKLKRTAEALEEQLRISREEVSYLSSVKHAFSMAETVEDIDAIRSEMISSGYIRSAGKGKTRQKPGKPMHYRSSDGHDIYVGRNNLQNDELTFKLATGKDIWFHAKHMPGSHVILKLWDSERTIDDVAMSNFEEAASLAAYYSSGSGKVEIDYTERKNLKKPPAAKPGYVIYHTNYSMMAEAEIKLEQIEG